MNSSIGITLPMNTPTGPGQFPAATDYRRWPQAMLILLQKRARDLGVEMRFETEFGTAEFRKDYHLVVTSDGINSAVRNEYVDVFKPDIDMRKCKFIWLGTHQTFRDAFTFIFEKTEHGWMWAHVYQFDDNTATFIVECLQPTWDSFGFENMSKRTSLKVAGRSEKYLGGHELIQTRTICAALPYGWLSTGHLREMVS